jgi:hypothetical protein
MKGFLVQEMEVRTTFRAIMACTGHTISLAFKIEGYRRFDLGWRYLTR